MKRLQATHVVPEFRQTYSFATVEPAHLAISEVSSKRRHAEVGPQQRSEERA